MSDAFDIAVIGAGPAGASAAIAGAEAGLRVALVDEQDEPGGQVWRAKSTGILAAPPTPEGSQGDALRRAVTAADLRFYGDSRIWQFQRNDGVWDIQCVREGASETIASRALILATGAREYVQPVPGWTTPGVLGLAGATAHFKRHLTVPGEATVVSGTGPLVFFVASEIRRLGGTVAAVVTPNARRDWLGALPALIRNPGLARRGAVWMADLALAGVPVFWRHAVASVGGTERVEHVSIKALDETWHPRGAARKIEADSVCLGTALIPSVEAAQLASLALRYDARLGGWIPDANPDGTTSVAGLYICGDGAGIRGAAAAKLQGERAGLTAAAALGGKPIYNIRPAKLARHHERTMRFGEAMAALSTLRPGLEALGSADTVYCRCESVTRAVLEDEIDSGAGSTNAVKSGTRAGMGACGGKYCQTAIARLIEAKRGLPEGSVQPPTARPPLRPVTLSSVTGTFDYDDLPIPEPAPL